MVAVAKEREETFPVAQWDLREGPKGLAYQGKPGTWLDLRVRSPEMRGVPNAWLAIVCCPACGEIFALHKRVHVVDAKGVITPVVSCTKATCSYRARIKLGRWDKRPLWAVAIAKTTREGTSYEMHTTHALTAEEARWHCSHLGREYQILSVGLAIDATEEKIEYEPHGYQIHVGES